LLLIQHYSFARFSGSSGSPKRYFF
jgi:hypothetical protein